jgi:hypothetical protein
MVMRCLFPVGLMIKQLVAFCVALRGWYLQRRSGVLPWRKVKGNFHPSIGHEGKEGKQRDSSTLSLTSAVDGGEWSTPHPGHFTPRKETQCPLYRREGGPQDRSRRLQDSIPGPSSPKRVAIPTELSRPFTMR